MKRIWFIIGLWVLAGCNPVYRPVGVQYEDYRVKDSLPPDPALENLVRSYRQEVESQMNTVIGRVAEKLEKRQPDCDLGNFMADAMRIRGSEKYGVTIDVAFVNYGGVRLNELTPGDLTRGKVFEMMPFDNLLVIQTVPGRVLKAFLDQQAARNGWPVSGLSYVIKNGRATGVIIGGKTFDESANYVVANSDFVVNGGDNMNQLRDIPAENKGYLVRDAIIEYVQDITARGENIKKPEIRIKNGE